MTNRLTKIYTRTGDDGDTGLADGNRIDKDSLRIDAIGDVDELNSSIGVLIASGISDDINGYLLNIQHRLFDIGGELATPGSSTVQSEHVIRLEELIETYNEELPPLKEFILPGGNLQGALCHLTRSVCRRVERNLLKLSREEYVNPITVMYMNRLSDLLFVFARELILKKGDKETYWESNRLKQSV